MNNMLLWYKHTLETGSTRDNHFCIMGRIIVIHVMMEVRMFGLHSFWHQSVIDDDQVISSSSWSWYVSSTRCPLLLCQLKSQSEESVVMSLERDIWLKCHIVLEDEQLKVWGQEVKKRASWTNIWKVDRGLRWHLKASCFVEETTGMTKKLQGNSQEHLGHRLLLSHLLSLRISNKNPTQFPSFFL